MQARGKETTPRHSSTTLEGIQFHGLLCGAWTTLCRYTPPSRSTWQQLSRLHDLFQETCSANSMTLGVPATHCSTLGDHAFSVAAGTPCARYQSCSITCLVPAETLMYTFLSHRVREDYLSLRCASAPPGISVRKPQNIPYKVKNSR